MLKKILQNFTKIFKDISNILEKMECLISNFLGAIYGKYIVNRPPSGRVSEYLKYIKTFPITLLAIVGPESECLYVDIGSNGRMNDSGIWNNCDKQQKIENND